MFNFFKKKTDEEDPLENVSRVQFGEHETKLFSKIDGLQRVLERLVQAKDKEFRASVEQKLEADTAVRTQQIQTTPELADGTPERANSNQGDNRGNAIRGGIVGLITAIVYTVISRFLGGGEAEAAEPEEDQPRPAPPPAPVNNNIPEVPRQPPQARPNTPSAQRTPTAPQQRSSAVRVPSPTASGAAGSLATLLQRGESGRANYNAVNIPTGRGTYRSSSRDLSQMSLNEVMEAQRRRELFAVGRYQIIPNTLREARQALRLNGDERFTPQLQDRIFREYLTGSKRPAIRDFLNGTSDNIEAALDEVANEWASVAGRNGRSVYDGIGGNSATISREEVRQALLADRAARLGQQATPPSVSSQRTAASGLQISSASQTAARTNIQVVDNSRTNVQTSNQSRTAPAEQPVLVPRNTDITRTAWAMNLDNQSRAA